MLPTLLTLKCDFWRRKLGMQNYGVSSCFVAYGNCGLWEFLLAIEMRIEMDSRTGNKFTALKQ